MAISKRAPVLDRLRDRQVVTESGCWLYTGSTDGQGYGVIGYHGRNYRVHRLAYELLVGPIGDGLVTDHECHNRDRSCVGGTACEHRRCFRPDHLSIVEPAVNNGSGQQGKRQRERTHCPAGHDYAEHGVVYPSSGGRRECRECKRLRSASWWAASRLVD